VPIALLDRNAIRREHRALIGRAVRPHGGALLVKPRGHAARIGILQHTFQRKEAAAANDGGFDLVVAPPRLQAAMRVEDFCEKLSHRHLGVMSA
jgi:hypothetical protein